MLDPIPIKDDESIFMKCMHCDEVMHDGEADSRANMPHAMECIGCGSGSGQLYYIDAYKCGKCGMQFSSRGDAEDCCQ